MNSIVSLPRSVFYQIHTVYIMHYATIHTIIIVCPQLYSRTVSVNANEIANGILTSLVAITAGCPFVNYWGACVIGCMSHASIPQQVLTTVLSSVM